MSPARVASLAGTEPESWNLVHLVPRMPPTIDALGEYATKLGAELESASEGRMRSAFVAAGLEHRVPHRAERFAEAILEAAAARATRRVLVCHYVGYGYAKRGAPLWLLDCIRRVRKEAPRMTVVTVFHELYARGWPHQSSFWLSPVQRHVAATLATASDLVVTNRLTSQRWLERRIRAGTPVLYAPIFSTVGEPERCPPSGDRQATAVLFGRQSSKEAMYTTHHDALVELLDRLAITRVTDLGARCPSARERFGHIPVDHVGLVDPQRVRTLLAHARIGVLRYAPDALTKSSVAAAYFAHGVIPLLFHEEEPAPTPDLPYLDAAELLQGDRAPDVAELARLGEEGFSWYARHASLAVTADRFTRFLAAHGAGSSLGSD